MASHWLMVAKAQVEDFLDAGAGVEHENEQCARFPYLKWRILRCPSLASFWVSANTHQKREKPLVGLISQGGISTGDTV